MLKLRSPSPQEPTTIRSRTAAMRLLKDGQPILFSTETGCIAVEQNFDKSFQCLLIVGDDVSDSRTIKWIGAVDQWLKDSIELLKK